MRYVFAALIAMFPWPCAAVDCVSAKLDAEWHPVEESQETRVVRNYAAGIALLDRNTSWGVEAWFANTSGSYLLCAADCSPDNEVLGIAIRYAIRFDPLPSGGFRVVELPVPQCPE